MQNLDLLTNIIVQTLVGLLAPAAPLTSALQDLFNRIPFSSSLHGKTILLLGMEAAVFAVICIITPLVFDADLGGIFSWKISLRFFGRAIPSTLVSLLAGGYCLFLLSATFAVAWQWARLDFESAALLLIFWSAATAVPVGAVFLRGYNRHGAYILGAGAACVAGTVAAGIAVGFCLTPFSVPARPYLLGAGMLPLIPLVLMKKLPRQYQQLAVPIAVALPAVALLGFAFAELTRLSHGNALSSWDDAGRMAVKITFSFLTFSPKIQRYFW